MTETDLRFVLSRAQQRNRQHAVTGVLLFDSGNFMQYIEGPPEGLAEVYKHIKRDPLHTGIIELSSEQTDARIFEAWAMGSRVLNAPEFTNAWLRDRVLDARLETLAQAPGAAAALLQGFWRRGQGRR